MPRFQPSLFDQQHDPIPVSGEITNLSAAARELTAAEAICAVTSMTAVQAGEVLRQAGGVRALARLTVEELRALPGVGPRRAVQIKAMTEWALALARLDKEEKVQIRSPADIAHLLMLEMGLLEQEELRVIGLDTKNQVMFIETVYKGSVNTTVVRISEVLREAVRRNCPGMVLAHNHPSGDPTPSPEDVRVTEMVVEAGSLLDIAILDHLVIGCNRYVSLKERGLGFR